MLNGGTHKIRSVGKLMRFAFFTIFILLAVAGYYFLSNFPISDKAGNYLIKNNYYAFKLSAPEGWVAEANSFYSEENISQIMDQCKNDLADSVVYEIGRFRIKSGRSEGAAILAVTINCVPFAMRQGDVENGLQYRISEYAGDNGLEKVIGGIVSSFEFIN